MPIDLTHLQCEPCMCSVDRTTKLDRFLLQLVINQRIKRSLEGFSGQQWCANTMAVVGGNRLTQKWGKIANRMADSG